MKVLVTIVVVLAVLGGLAAVAYQPMAARLKEQKEDQWQTAKVTRGRIIEDRTATGKVEPVLSVSIGSFVSGPITDLYVDFNDKVKDGQLLARVDPRRFEADVTRDEAILASRKADVERAKALLKQSIRNEQRAIALRNENPDFISAREMDSFHFERVSLQAQLKLSEAAVKQAEAALDNSRLNLKYTDIVSVVDGIVTDKKISEGQTLAAQFQTPELFIVAPDMEKKMYVIASVDEADIGAILEAKRRSLPVEFTVDAYPDVFKGEIEQVRMNYTTTETVVTYPVVVAAANPDLKLMPGMTAYLSFEVDFRDDVLRVPDAAVRFFPADVKKVREEDRGLITGEGQEEEEELPSSHLTEEQRKELERRKKRHHVWVREGEFLKAVPVELGITDLRYHELVSGELSEGDELLIGEKKP